MSHSRPLFLYYRLFWIVIDRYTLELFHCRCRDSNHGSLVSKVTALPTAPQPRPHLEAFLITHKISRCTFLKDPIKDTSLKLRKVREKGKTTCRIRTNNLLLCYALPPPLPSSNLIRISAGKYSCKFHKGVTR